MVAYDGKPVGSGRRIIFIRACALFFVLSALAKMQRLLHPQSADNTTNPIIPLTNGAVLWLACFFELGTSALLLILRSEKIRLGLIAYAGGVFCTYRLGLVYLGLTKPCGCLGNLGEWVGLSSRLEGTLLFGIALAMLFGGLALLVVPAAAGNKTARS